MTLQLDFKLRDLIASPGRLFDGHIFGVSITQRRNFKHAFRGVLHGFGTADAGTFKLAVIHSVGTDQGIHNFTGVSGTQTVDGYAGVGAANTYTEVTGIAVTAGLKTIQDSMATKNASSSAYGGKVNTWAYVRTGA